MPEDKVELTEEAVSEVSSEAVPVDENPDGGLDLAV